VRRAEFVRWDTEIYGRAGAQTIIIDVSLMPVLDDAGQVMFLCAEGRDITEKKAQGSSRTLERIGSTITTELTSTSAGGHRRSDDARRAQFGRSSTTCSTSG
jgi:hypothetical protein